MIYFIIATLSFIITIILMPFFIKLATKTNYIDVPGERKVHRAPVPVLGGLVMVIAILSVVFLMVELTRPLKGYVFSLLVLVVVGMIDDHFHIRAREKFIGQVIAALVAIFVGGVRVASIQNIAGPGGIDLGLLSLPITLLLIVGMTNAINLADGLDGLAAGLSFITFCCVAYIAHLFGESNIVLIATAILGALLGFLRYNTHPAIIFMGDTGSQFLGFSAAVLSIMLTQKHVEVLSSALPILMLGFPIIDMAAVMTERIINKRSPFKADKNHFHHKLMRIGFYHSEAVSTIYLMHALLVTGAFMFRFYSDIPLLLGFLVLAVVIIGLFTFAEKRGFTIRPLSTVSERGQRGFSLRELLSKKAFGILLLLLPTALLIFSLFPYDTPWDVGIISVVLLFLIATLFFLKRRMAYVVIEFATYYVGSFFIYAFEVQRLSIDFQNQHIMTTHVMNAFFIAITVLIVIYIVSNNRIEEFRLTPLHFLILFMLVVVPNLPEYHIQQYHLGPVTAKVVIFLLGYEILFRRTTKRLKFLTMATVCAMLLICGRAGVHSLLG
jgi:UDP-GlcNAc:undecaprenyl-phosphate GlcNAc-1-phosphate transferase